MMARSGRDLRISRDGVPVVGARSDDLSLNGEPVDVTDKDDNGWRKLLPVHGVKSAEGTISGVFKNGDLAEDILDGDSPMLGHKIEVGPNVIMFGDFKLVNYNPTGNHDGTIEFTAGIQSSGALAVLMNLVRPAVTGTAQVGQTLTTTNGTWLGSPSFARQWQFNDGTGWANITGETGLTYTIDVDYLGDNIRCRVTATTSYGSVVAFSNETAAVIAA